MAATQSPVALALYHYRGCPFCEYVLSTIESLGLEVEMRDIMRDPEHRRALVEARGRQTVPVLAITEQDGSTHLMPESRDIMHWLREAHADGRLAALVRDGK